MVSQAVVLVPLLLRQPLFPDTGLNKKSKYKKDKNLKINKNISHIYLLISSIGVNII